jgi:type I pantothenate kinase
VPVYSHDMYDIVPGQFQTINQFQVLILEGLNVLQGSSRDSAAVAADYFDFSLYLDADEKDAAQGSDIIDFLKNRSLRQGEARDSISLVLKKYNGGGGGYPNR